MDNLWLISVVHGLARLIVDVPFGIAMLWLADRGGLLSYFDLPSMSFRQMVGVTMAVVLLAPSSLSLAGR